MLLSIFSSGPTFTHTCVLLLALHFYLTCIFSYLFSSTSNMAPMVLPYELSCGLLIYVFSQKLKEIDGWNDKGVFNKETQRKVLIGILKIIRNPDNNWESLLNEVKIYCPDELVLAFIEEAKSLADEEELLNFLKVLKDLVENQLSSCLLYTSPSPRDS